MVIDAGEIIISPAAAGPYRYGRAVASLGNANIVLRFLYGNGCL